MKGCRHTSARRAPNPPPTRQPCAGPEVSATSSPRSRRSTYGRDLRRAGAGLALVAALGLALPSAHATRALGSRFFTLRTAHFDIHYDDGAEAFATRVAAIAEAARRLHVTY